MTKKQTEAKIKEVLEKGNWMIRGDDNGVSYNGFKWNPVGVWTKAPDWKPTQECEHGLHGQDKDHGGYISGKRLVFCETDGEHIDLNNKIKVKRARILMIGLPQIKEMQNLNLRGCTLPDGIKLPDSVGGWLDLQDCTLPDGIKLPDSVGNLNLRGCTLPDGIKLPKVSGKIYK